MRNRIYWEWCKRLKFDYTIEWSTHEPESVLENVMYKILWDFYRETDLQIPARRPDLVLINQKKRTCHPVDFAVLVGHRMKIKQSKTIDKYMDFASELKTTVEHESDRAITFTFGNTLWKGMNPLILPAMG